MSQRHYKNPYRGYEIKNRKGVSEWASTLEEWLFMIERYCRVIDGEEAPYLYNERTNIGIVSGAVWRSGKISLEEFGMEKGVRTQKKRYGRCDLWISGYTDGTEEYIEAKQKWIHAHSTDIQNSVEKTMAKAIKDADASRGNIKEKARGIALGFFPIYSSKKPQEITSLIDQFKKTKHHAIAWSFPEEMEDYQSEKKKYAPGIVMLIINIDHHKT